MTPDELEAGSVENLLPAAISGMRELIRQDREAASA
jgi:hypothetical protein